MLQSGVCCQRNLNIFIEVVYPAVIVSMNFSVGGHEINATHIDNRITCCGVVNFNIRDMVAILQFTFYDARARVRHNPLALSTCFDNGILDLRFRMAGAHYRIDLFNRGCPCATGERTDNRSGNHPVNNFFHEYSMSIYWLLALTYAT
ncbi:hypothetical protein KPSB59_3490005 [Klebsiella quasipneumoniae subsp. quasipneumoniae]|nr:hypothetical protein KPSB59_3490005 [Klebsiella quasipneumoniae subsp. quasipneumoniae]CDQ16792.1 hypothetical protein KQQSB11_450018 [Klebsiella quasipneumoniae subsp. quasipneumoniae]